MSPQNKTKFFACTLISLVTCSLHAGQLIGEITVSNSSENFRIDEAITIQLQGLGVCEKEWDKGTYIVKRDGARVPSQTIDTNGDGKRDSVFFLSTLEGSGSADYRLYQSKANEVAVGAKRTQADLSHKINGEWVEGKTAGDKDRGNWEYVGGEWADVSYLKVPEKHSDHANYIRYEGIGIESDKVGYRIYTDWRNGFDIWGKTSSDLMLKKAGLDGFESYPSHAGLGDGYFEGWTFPGNWGLRLLGR